MRSTHYLRLKLTALALGLLLIVVIVAVPVIHQAASTTTVTASDVQVTVSLARNSADNTLLLTARYTPLRADFHVYSKELPINGLDGLGRPTRLEPLSGLSPAGALVADQPIVMEPIAGLTEIFPVYPDGSVTLSLPVVATRSDFATVRVSYMACSSHFGCLPPTEQIVQVAIP